jgi:hypothetical protein
MFAARPRKRTNAYAILGVDHSATDEEIRAAYLGLVKIWHPDRRPGDRAAEERFKRINLAYERLRDPERRAEYDRRMHFHLRPSSRRAIASRWRRRSVRRKAGFAACGMAGCCALAAFIQFAPAPAPPPVDESKVADRIPSAFEPLSAKQARKALALASPNFAVIHDDRWDRAEEASARAAAHGKLSLSGLHEQHLALMAAPGEAEAPPLPARPSLASREPPQPPSPPTKPSLRNTPAGKPRVRALAQANDSLPQPAAAPRAAGIRLASGEPLRPTEQEAQARMRVEEVLAGGL